VTAFARAVGRNKPAQFRHELLAAAIHSRHAARRIVRTTPGKGKGVGTVCRAARGVAEERRPGADERLSWREGRAWAEAQEAARNAVSFSNKCD
jgi:hypothetical protein